MEENNEFQRIRTFIDLLSSEDYNMANINELQRITTSGTGYVILRGLQHSLKDLFSAVKAYRQAYKAE